MAAESRETKSDERQNRDLDAQIRAADAAEQQVFPSWLAAILSFAGTLLIIWSLKIARDANRIAREGQRPWLDFEVVIDKATFHRDTLGFHYTIPAMNAKRFSPSIAT